MYIASWQSILLTFSDVILEDEQLDVQILAIFVHHLVFKETANLLRTIVCLHLDLHCSLFLGTTLL